MNRNYTNLFIKLAQWNCFEEITYLVELYPDLKNKIEQAFYHSCSNGHLEMAQWLYQINSTLSIYTQEESFRRACQYGHLPVAQWLYQINPSINISAQNEYAFTYACSKGHLEVAQWLYQIKPTMVIPQETFHNVCSKGHLQVAQWLYQINPTLYTYNTVYESIVPWVGYHYGILEVAQWLQSLFPDRLFIQSLIYFDETVQLLQDEDTICSICTEKSVTVQTHCKHNYCKDCLTKWLSSHSTCPHCRDPISKVYSITSKKNR